MKNIMRPTKKQRGIWHPIKAFLYIAIVLISFIILGIGLNFLSVLSRLMILFPRQCAAIIFIVVTSVVFLNLKKTGEERDKELLNIPISEIQKPLD